MFGSKRIGILKNPGFNDIGSAIGAVAGFLGSSEQSDAAKSAAAQSAAASQAAIDLQKQMYDQTRADQAPWRETGQSSLNMLANYMGVDNPYAQYYGMSDEEIRRALEPQFIAAQAPHPANRPLASEDVSPSMLQALGRVPFFQNRLMNQQGAQSATGYDEAALAARIAEIKRGLRGYDPNASERGSLLRPFSMADYQADPGYAFRLSEGMKALERSAAARGGLLSGATLKGVQRYGQDMASQEYQNAYNRYQSNQSNQFNRLASMAGLGQTANQALQQAGSGYANAVGSIGIGNAANQGNAALIAGQSRASAYGGIGTALGNALNSGVWGRNPSTFDPNTPYASSYDPTIASQYLG